MIKWVLTTYTPSIETFETYWWGYGTILEQTLVEDTNQWMTVVDYEDDDYRCEMQSGRFASGLYYSKVEGIET